VRKGQAPDRLEREAFRRKFMDGFYDPAFEAVAGERERIQEIAWQAYRDQRKAPRTVQARPAFAAPGYDLSLARQETRDRLLAAEARQKEAATPSRVLLVNAAARNDGTCPGEISKSWRLSNMARQALEAQGTEVDLLDLSRLTSDYDR